MIRFPRRQPPPDVLDVAEAIVAAEAARRAAAFERAVDEFRMARLDTATVLDTYLATVTQP